GLSEPSPGGGVRVLLGALRAGVPVPQAARVCGLGHRSLRWWEAGCHEDEPVGATVDRVANHVGQRSRCGQVVDVAVPNTGVVAARGAVATGPAHTGPDTRDLAGPVLVELPRCAVHTFLTEAGAAPGAGRRVELQRRTIRHRTA